MSDHYDDFYTPPINKSKETTTANTNKDLKNPFNYQEGGSHYKIEGVMDVAEWSKRRGHCPYQANVIKYVDRHKKKNGIEDLRKAKQYLEFIAYVEYGENL